MQETESDDEGQGTKPDDEESVDENSRERTPKIDNLREPHEPVGGCMLLWLLWI